MESKSESEWYGVWQKQNTYSEWWIIVSISTGVDVDFFFVIRIRNYISISHFVRSFFRLYVVLRTRFDTFNFTFVAVCIVGSAIKLNRILTTCYVCKRFNSFFTFFFLICLCLCFTSLYITHSVRMFRRSESMMVRFRLLFRFVSFLFISASWIFKMQRLTNKVTKCTKMEYNYLLNRKPKSRTHHAVRGFAKKKIKLWPICWECEYFQMTSRLDILVLAHFSEFWSWNRFDVCQIPKRWKNNFCFPESEIPIWNDFTSWKEWKENKK